MDYAYVVSVQWMLEGDERMMNTIAVAVATSFSGAKRAIKDWFREHPEMDLKLTDEEVDDLKEPEGNTTCIGTDYEDMKTGNILEYIWIEKVPFYIS